MEIKDTVAFVTGANRGVGLSLVNALLEAGVRKVYAGVRNPDALTGFEHETKVIPVKLDVTNREQVQHAAELAADTTLIFNNAGVLEFGDALETAEDSFRRILETNFFGKLNLAKAFAPVLEKNGGGTLVNTLTLLSLASMPGFAAYNASKAAAWSISLSLRASLQPKGIKVVNAFPGAIDTDMLSGVEIPKTSPNDVAARILEAVGSDAEDVFPDPMSEQVYEAWRQDHKAVEKQFAGM